MVERVRCPNPACGEFSAVDSADPEGTLVCQHCGQPLPRAVMGSDDAAKSETGIADSTEGAFAPRSEDAPSSEALGTLPQRIGRFEIRKRLGSGGFGTVYLAHDPVLDRDVALKVPQPAVLENPRARERFLREPKAAAQLQHPNIVPVFDTGTDGEHHYIAAAFIEGKTLQETIAQEKPGFRRIAEVVRALASALDYAHSKGIVHRDVKPANVMVNNAGQPMLMDFGLAHLQESEDQLTRDGAVMGTPAYMAPEQADRGRGEVGPTSDQYALGVVLYHLLCGEPPFSGPPSVVLFNVLNQEPKAPRAQDKSVPKDLETICLKAMAKEADARYTHCSAMAEDLRRWLEDRPIIARRVGPVERFGRWCRRKPVLASATMAAFLLFAVSSVLSGLSWRATEAKAAAQRQLHVAELKQTEVERELEVRSEDVAVAEARLAGAKTAQERVLAEQALAEARRLYEESRVKRLGETSRTVSQTQETLSANVEKSEAELELERRLKDPKVPDIKPSLPRKTPGEPLSPYALVTRPAKIDGIDSWTIETKPIRSGEQVYFSPDSKYLASRSLDHSVRIWDVSTRQLRHILLSADGIESNQLAWAPDSQHLAVASGNRIAVWQLSDTPKQLLSFEAPSQYLDWSPDGSRLAIGGRIFDLEQSDWDATFDTGYLTAVAWSPDARKVAVSSDGVIRIWVANTETPATELSSHGSRNLSQLQWSPDGKYIAFCSSDEVLILLEETGEVVAKSPDVHEISHWSHDSRWLFCRFHEQSFLWNVLSEEKCRVDSHSLSVWAPNERWFARGDLSLYDSSTQEEFGRSTYWSDHWYDHITISPDGLRIAVPVMSSYDLPEVRITSLPALDAPVSAPLPWRPGVTTWARSGNSLVVVAHESQNARIVDGATLKTNDLAWESGPTSVKWAAFSPDGKQLLLSGEDAAILIDVAKGKIDREITSAGPVAWSGDGSRLLVGGRVFSPGGQVELIELNLPPDMKPSDWGLCCPAWAQDRTRLALVASNRIFVFDAETGAKLSDWDADACSLWWSPKGTRLFAVEVHSLVQIDLVNNEKRPLDQPIRISHAAIHPSGRFAVTRTVANTIELLTLETAEPIAKWLAVDSNNSNMIITPNGHWRGSPQMADQIVYVVETADGQETLTPAQMTEKHGWTNDPSQAVIQWSEAVQEIKKAADE